jgi:carbonic anhydrase/acetyltransferase-like protein (isoleucine patch superfamily)
MLRDYKGLRPRVAEGAFVADSAQVIGDVTVGPESSVWFGAVIRGDVHSIRLGSRTNIQDLSVIHVTSGRFSTRVGDDVTVGHRVILHGCTVGNRVLVGMGAVLLDGVTVGDDCLIGAGALLTPGTVIPPGSLVLGSPARVKRPLTEEERTELPQSAARYVALARDYR